ncbi:MAG: hypothetical protein GY789_17350 [Hyphomicrobiales bacterium]|nr:hypothetical protein [Hyphomicrobiales bacterium]
MSAYLNALPISDVGESGVDNRGELNATMTLAGLGYFKKPFGEYLAEHATGLPRGQGTYTVGPFAGSFERFLRATQDPITGYWGAVYRSDGRLYRSTDLSMTSHIVGYRKGQVDFRPAIVKTTLRIATNTSEFK